MKQGALRLSATALGAAAITLLMPVPPANAAVRHHGLGDQQCIVRGCTLHTERRGTGAITTHTAGAVNRYGYGHRYAQAGAATVGAAWRSRGDTMADITVPATLATAIAAGGTATTIRTICRRGAARIPTALRV